MNELLKLFGIYSIGTAFIVSVIGYLAKKIIGQILNKDLEKFKDQLQSQNEIARLKFEKEIENYKSNLNLVYSKQIQLYSKKSEIIEQLYKTLVDLNNSMIEMTQSFRNITGKNEDTIQQEELDRVNTSAEKGNDFFKFYLNNKIYFGKDTCSLIEDLQKQFKDSHTDYSFRHTFGLPASEMTYEMAKKASDRVRDDIPKLMEKLENDFRETLGILEMKIKNVP
jgi:uncharacterized membrane-anchored protein YhcB (DUF1043 family)